MFCFYSYVLQAQLGQVEISEGLQAILAPAVLPRTFLSLQVFQTLKSNPGIIMIVDILVGLQILLFKQSLFFVGWHVFSVLSTTTKVLAYLPQAHTLGCSFGFSGFRLWRSMRLTMG